MEGWEIRDCMEYLLICRSLMCTVLHGDSVVSIGFRGKPAIVGRPWFSWWRAYIMLAVPFLLFLSSTYKTVPLWPLTKNNGVWTADRERPLEIDTLKKLLKQWKSSKSITMTKFSPFTLNIRQLALLKFSLIVYTYNSSVSVKSSKWNWITTVLP